MRSSALIAALAILVGAVTTPTSRALAAGHLCPDAVELEQWRLVLDAEWIACVRLDDLTTTANPYTDPNSLTGMGFPPPGTGTLNSHYTDPTTPAVPGIQIHGYFSDGCNAFLNEPVLTAKNGVPFMPGCVPAPAPAGATCLVGCHHDGQVVLRIPDAWNARLLTAGTPGIRDAFSSDFILSDFALEHGWAYVAQDKGNMGANFYQSGCDEIGRCATWPDTCVDVSTPWCPAAAVAEWTFRMRQATRSARALLDRLAPSYGQPRVVRSYAAGISNGGYQVRRALETDTSRDRLYDGGVDWEGTLFLSRLPAGVTAAGPKTGFNLFTYLPTSLAKWPNDLVEGDPSVRDLADVGFEPASQPLWPYHWSIYWGLTQKIYRLEFDPEYTRFTCSDVLTAGPACVAPPALQVPPADPDAAYDYPARLAALPPLAARLDRVANTGDIQHPLITLHGDQDALLPIRTDSDIYTQLVALQHRGARHRYYVVAGGNHVDGQFDDHYGVDPYGDTLRPMLPCVRAAVDALVAWVEQSAPPPPSRTIARLGTSAEELANRCRLTD